MAESYWFQYPQYPNVFDNPYTATVTISNSLDVSGMITTDDILGSNAVLNTVVSSLVVSSNVLASNAQAISTWSCNLNVNNFSIDGHNISTPYTVSSNGYIDFSWLTADPLSNVVWQEKWATEGKTAGAITGAVSAMTLATTLYEDPLTSVIGLAGYDAAQALAGVDADTAGYDLAIETLVPFASWVANMVGAKLAGAAAHEASYLTAQDAAEADSIGVAAGESAIIAEQSTPAGWGTVSALVVTPLGTLAGSVAGNTVNITTTKATVAEHTAQIETLTTDVSALDDLTATHTADIATIDTTLSGVVTDVAAIDVSITAIETELTSTTDTANNALSTAQYTSNAQSNYLALSGGTMIGIMYSCSIFFMKNKLGSSIGGIRHSFCDSIGRYVWGYVYSGICFPKILEFVW